MFFVIAAILLVSVLRLSIAGSIISNVNLIAFFALLLASYIAITVQNRALGSYGVGNPISFLAFSFAALGLGVFCGVSTIDFAIIQFGILALFSFIINNIDDNALEKVFAGYLILAVYVAATGLIAWAFVVCASGSNFERVTLNDLGGRAITNDLHHYAFPYFLGLVMVDIEMSHTEVFGFYIPRPVGLMEESHQAALFVMPAIIFLINAQNVSRVRYFKIILLVVLISFWILCMSMASYVAVFVTYVFVKLVRLLRDGRLLNACFLAIWATLLPALFYIFELSGYIESGYLGSKLNVNSHTFRSTMSSLGFAEDSNYAQALLGYLFAVTMTLFAMIRSDFLLRKNVFSVVLLYMVFYGAKGAWWHQMVDPFVLMFFIFCLRSSNDLSLRLFQGGPKHLARPQVLVNI